MTRESLGALAETAAAAVLATLAELGVEDSHRGAVSTPEEAGSAFDGFELPVQAASVAGAAGRTTFALTQSGATRVAAELAGEGRSLDIGLLGEAPAKLAAAAAAAVATRLGRPDEAAPATRLVAEPDPDEAWEAGAPVVSIAFTICEEPALLVLSVAADVLQGFDPAAPVAVEAGGEACGVEGAIAGESLREVKVRLWAELGRARMALGRAVGLAPGEVVELDAAVDDPVIVFVNGVRLGSGQLVVGDDGEWAFRVLEVSSASAVHRELEGNAASGAEHAGIERNDGRLRA